MILTTEKGSRDGGCDAGEVQLEAGLVRVLGVRGEGVEDRGHDHADLVAADHDQDDAELLPRGPARDRRRHEVPQEERQEEEEAEEMCPDVERLVVEGEDGAETLRPTLSRSVPATNQHRHRDKSILSPPIIAAMCVVPGVPQYCFHFVFVIFSGSGARTEELLTFIQQPLKFAT